MSGFWALHADIQTGYPLRLREFSVLVEPRAPDDTLPRGQADAAADVEGPETGKLLVGESRRVGDFFLVPTSNGGLCYFIPRLGVTRCVSMLVHGIAVRADRIGYDARTPPFTFHGIAVDGVEAVELCNNDKCRVAETVRNTFIAVIPTEEYDGLTHVGIRFRDGRRLAIE